MFEIKCIIWVHWGKSTLPFDSERLKRILKMKLSAVTMATLKKSSEADPCPTSVSLASFSQLKQTSVRPMMSG